MYNSVLPSRWHGRQHTFSTVTKSAACNNVSPEMSSTIRDTVGSFGFDTGGSGGGVDFWEESVAVVKNLEVVAVLW